MSSEKRNNDGGAFGEFKLTIDVNILVEIIRHRTLPGPPPHALMLDAAHARIDVHSDIDSKVLFGVLNSSFAQAEMEVWGRNEAGMLQLMTYETKSLPLPDIRSMTDDERKAIGDIVDDILDRGNSEISEAHRDELDTAVLDTLDLDEDTSVDRIQEIQQYMLNRRVKSGENIEILVGEMEVFDETGTRSVTLQREANDGQEELGDF